ncbi:hypothetical protein CLW00_10483 [Mongoliibacter ruber]|uniref:Uncharacterized protein n=1 Tax=Mongoliibacter ruber TaxID=1750599 RepID=A0A2T0WP15_9BACT|nr:hypothetical protein CLW00_10483 [Mongoliibacter ruber]
MNLRKITDVNFYTLKPIEAQENSINYTNTSNTNF